MAADERPRSVLSVVAVCFMLLIALAMLISAAKPRYAKAHDTKAEPRHQADHRHHK